ncbi:hypothetical protein ZHAS_00021840 [Anopheles sinensis]|uniref:Uncharacterized protein n=1 Tax=Anopheles sinensis TaxID=74873 RepID=A0A084WTQ7_ANOSI|nr:hypothetical protein ZHAS_00021840 [Anopheles sinensis]
MEPRNEKKPIKLTVPSLKRRNSVIPLDRFVFFASQKKTGAQKAERDDDDEIIIHTHVRAETMRGRNDRKESEYE